MKVRKQYGVPSGPPHVGEDELLLDEATGRFYGRLADGMLVPLTFSGKDERLGGGTEPVTNGEDSIAFGEYAATGRVIVPVDGEDTVAGWTKATKTLLFDNAQDLSGVSPGDEVMLYAWGEGYAGKGVVASVDDGADTLVLTTEVLSDDFGVEVVVLPTIYANQGKGALVTGSWNAAQGAGAMVGGSFNQALGNTSFAMGSENKAVANEAAVFGLRGEAYWPAALVLGGNTGKQVQQVVLGATTVNATPKRLSPNNASAHIPLKDERVYLCTALVVGRSTSTDVQAAYELKALLKRGVGVGTVAVVGSVAKTVIHEDSAGWDATIDVNVTEGSVEVQVTGESLSILWTGLLQVVEVAY